MNIARWLVLLCAMATTGYCITVAGATPPPPEYRAMYLLPDLTGPYYNQSASSGFPVTAFRIMDGSSSPFPGLSQYRAFRNFTYGKTGETFIAEVWYFDDWATFESGRDVLTGYLQKHGTASPVILDISGDLERTGDPSTAGLHATRINATAYQAVDTAGYFIIFSTDFFPGENYYIAYYGTAGRSDLEAASPQLRTLIISCFPGFVEGRTYTFDPVSPENPAVSLPVVLPLLAAGVCFTACAIMRLSRRPEKE